MKRKTVRTVLSLLLLLLFAGAGYVYWQYNKPHRSAAEEKAIAVNAPQIAAEFEQDENIANKKYLGNAVCISGRISELSVNQQNKPVVILTGTSMSGVQCSLLKDAASLRKGDSITVTGFCSGYLTDVVLDRCIVKE